MLWFFYFHAHLSLFALHFILVVSWTLSCTNLFINGVWLIAKYCVFFFKCLKEIMRTADLNKILAKKLQLRWKLDFPPDVTWFFCLLLQNKLLLLLLEVSQESLHRYTHTQTHVQWRNLLVIRGDSVVLSNVSAGILSWSCYVMLRTSLHSTTTSQTSVLRAQLSCKCSQTCQTSL